MKWSVIVLVGFGLVAALAAAVLVGAMKASIFRRPLIHSQG